MAYRHDGGFTVAVPAVVVEEAVRQYEKHLGRRPERAHEELARPGEVDVPPGDDPMWLQRYRSRLLESADEHGIAVLEEPPDDRIDEWRREARKPFKNDTAKKDGDARVWATALQAAAQQRVILVSANRKDFGSDPQTLAPELLGDLEQEGLQADQVLLRPSIVSALGELGAPQLERAHAADLLERGRGRSELLRRAHRAATDRLLDDGSVDLLPFGVELDPESVYVTDFTIERIEVNHAYRIGDEIVVEASVFGEALVDVIVYKAEAYALDDDSPIVIHDWDYNDHYAEGEAYLQLDVVLETTVDDARNVSAPIFVGARPPAAP